MDRTPDCGSGNAGSIPAESTEKINSSYVLVFIFYGKIIGVYEDG